MVCMSTYKKNVGRGTTAADRLDSVRYLLVQKNRHYFKTVAEVILLCARQDVGLRGHCESKTSPNRGNFMLLLTMVRLSKKGCSMDLGMLYILLQAFRIRSLPNIMANMVKRTICITVKEAGIYSLWAE